MKKILSILLILLFLTGCGGIKEKDVIGTYTGNYKSTVSATPQKNGGVLVASLPDGQYTIMTMYLTLKEDGTYRLKRIDNSTDIEASNANGTWTLEDGVVILSWDSNKTTRNFNVTLGERNVTLDIQESAIAFPDRLTMSVK